MTVEMWLAFLEDVLFSQQKIALLIASLLVAGTFLIIARRSVNPRRKLMFLRIHLIFVFAPLIFLAFTWECGMPLLSCGPMKTLVSIPAAVLASYVAGLILLPNLYVRSLRAKSLNHNLAGKLTKFLGVEPKFYLIDKQEPLAFVRPNKHSIYFSVGLLDIMTKRELEAVLLHEAHHIKSHSPDFKFSLLFSKILSPISWLCSMKTDDEVDADEFASSIQGTRSYIKTARKKITDFYS